MERNETKRRRARNGETVLNPAERERDDAEESHGQGVPSREEREGGKARVINIRIDPGATEKTINREGRCAQ